MAGGSAQRGVTVTSRALALLGAFDEDHRELTLTELAERAAMPLPTAHRLVGELVAWGALARDQAGRYVIGRRLWDVGLLAPLQSGMVEIASPYLHDLYAATRATVHLAVLDGHEVLYLDRVRGNASVPIVSTVGSRLPLHATGVGKVLLAFAGPDLQAATLASLERITPYTVTQPGVLHRQLDRARREGCATTVEEMSLGACSVAVPVWRGDRVVAALGIVVPSLRKDRARLVTALEVTARGVGRALVGRAEQRDPEG